MPSHGSEACQPEKRMFCQVELTVRMQARNIDHLPVAPKLLVVHVVYTGVCGQLLRQLAAEKCIAASDLLGLAVQVLN